MSKQDSTITKLERGQVMQVTMFKGTTDSQFTLMHGVPSNSLGRIEDYFWTEVIRDGKPVILSLTKDNPLVIDNMFGTFKLRNDGLEDEQAVIDVTVYKG